MKRNGPVHTLCKGFAVSFCTTVIVLEIVLQYLRDYGYIY